MDIGFFEKLSNEEAKLYLGNFLNEVSKGFSQIIPNLINGGIKADYSIESIKPILIWVIGNIKIAPEKNDESIPKWITETEIYKKGLYSFDNFSKILVLRAAYYFGECFIKNHEKLYWDVGKSNTIEQNMPVITGFKKRKELAPVMVCENLIRGIVEGKDPCIIDVSLKTWVSFID